MKNITIQLKYTSAAFEIQSFVPHNEKWSMIKLNVLSNVMTKCINAMSTIPIFLLIKLEINFIGQKLVAYDASIILPFKHGYCMYMDDYAIQFCSD